MCLYTVTWLQQYCESVPETDSHNTMNIMLSASRVICADHSSSQSHSLTTTLSVECEHDLKLNAVTILHCEAKNCTILFSQ